jgi:hypothetical protein
MCNIYFFLYKASFASQPAAMQNVNCIARNCLCIAFCDAIRVNSSPAVAKAESIVAALHAFPQIRELAAGCYVPIIRAYIIDSLTASLERHSL